MKHASILVLLITLAGSARAGIEPGLPTGVCSGDFCGPSQRRVWDRFQSFSGLQRRSVPGVYSGACFHNSPRLDGSHVHFGAVLIDEADGRLFFDGRFSFFTDGNPYSRMSLEDARAKFSELFHPDHALQIQATYAFVSLEDRFVSRRYWFRHDRIGGALALVGYFGPLQTILCELKLNGGGNDETS